MDCVNRYEIDTSPPFRSVKEAVSLFSERVLSGEVYAAKSKQVRSSESGDSKIGEVAAEMEETKQCLEKARKQGTLMANSLMSLPEELQEIAGKLEETKHRLEKAREKGTLMANSLTSLPEELDRTNKELQKLKKHEYERKMMEVDKEIEDVEFIEPPRSFETNNENEAEFQKRRYVTFASPPMLEQTVIPRYEESLLHKHPSLDEKKKHNKKKTLLPLIGGLLHRKKRGHEVAPAKRDW